MLSAFITTPFRRSAALRANADLPLAVGPAIARTGWPEQDCEESVDCILTLVAPPGARLDPSLLDSARTALAVAGVKRIGAGAPFAAGRAADVDFAGDPWDPTVADAVRAMLASAPVDYAIQPARPRIKALLIADMDSTMVASETLDDMAAAAGVGERIAAITKRAMNGELDFEAALRERVGLLAGMDADILATTYAGMAMNPGAEALVAGMRGAGADCRLVSGGFRYFTERVAERLGFHRQQSNDIGIADGKLTGTVLEPILDGGAKVRAMQAAMTELQIDVAAVAAIGDGSNDIPMLQAAGLGVAWRGKPAVKAAARACIDHGDLTTRLLFQRIDSV